MAKSLRASTKKSNRVLLRSKVFAPVEILRNERLAAKLLELSSRPRQKEPNDVDMDETDKLESGGQANNFGEVKSLSQGKTDLQCRVSLTHNETEMEVDGVKPPTPKLHPRLGSGKIRKMKREKKRSIVFNVGRGSSKNGLKRRAAT